MTAFKAKPQHVYFDKRSYEKGVGSKEKYKLAGYPSPISGLRYPRIFWVLTSQDGRYPSGTTVTIEQSHWSKFDPGCLMEPRTYLSHSHSEHITNADVILKRRDPSNGFRLKARLSDDKFQEFKDKLSKLKLSPVLTIEDIKSIAISTTNTEEDANDILKKLHLM